MALLSCPTRWALASSTQGSCHPDRPASDDRCVYPLWGRQLGRGKASSSRSNSSSSSHTAMERNGKEKKCYHQPDNGIMNIMVKYHEIIMNLNLSQFINRHDELVGGFNTSEKIVSWDHYSQYMGNMFQTTNQIIIPTF